MTPPFFSLVVLTYNSIDTLGETLGSLTKLAGLEMVELILADDGSSDGTREALVQWGGQHGSRFGSIRLDLYESNVGISAAHARAFSRAQGVWGLYLGGDDLIVEPQFFSRLRQILEGASGHLYRTLVKEYRSDSGQIIDFSDTYRFLRHLSADRQYRYLAGTGYPFGSGPGTVFRVSTLWELNGFGGYNRAFEDWQLYLRFTRAGYRIGFLDLPGVLWRRHDGQFSTASRDRMAVGNRQVKRKEIIPYLNRLSLFERWKFRHSGRLSQRLNLYYRWYLETWGKLFRE